MRLAACLVGYTFRSYPPATAFAHAVSAGYAGVELRDFRGYDWWSVGGICAALQDTAALARGVGLEPMAAFLPIEVSADSAAAERYGGVLARLRKLDIGIWHTQVRLPGVADSRGASAQCYRNAASFLTRLGAQAAAAGVSIAIESHMGTIHDTAEAQWRLLERCESTAITASLDFANLLIAHSHEDLEAAIRRCAGRIGYVHLKNAVNRPGGWDWSVPLRMGDIDYRRLLPVLCGVYDGPLGIEYCGAGDPVWVAADDRAYLSEVMPP